VASRLAAPCEAGVPSDVTPCPLRLLDIVCQFSIRFCRPVATKAQLRLIVIATMRAWTVMAYFEERTHSWTRIYCKLLPQSCLSF
jgi:hypothetical protein